LPFKTALIYYIQQKQQSIVRHGNPENPVKDPAWIFTGAVAKAGIIHGVLVYQWSSVIHRV